MYICVLYIQSLLCPLHLKGMHFAFLTLYKTPNRCTENAAVTFLRILIPPVFRATFSQSVYSGVTLTNHQR